jgi:hypothetical protein
MQGMTSRREFLERMSWTLVPMATGLPAAAAAVAPTTSSAVNHAALSPLHAVLVDNRHAVARGLGARLAAQGVRVRAITDGDITDLWLQDIGPALRRRPVALAGLTASSTLFCLEQLAWAHRMQVVFHAEHVVLPSQQVEHHVQHRSTALARVDAGSLAAAGADWNERIAEVLESYDPRLQINAAGPSCAGLDPALPDGAVLLASWVIAPV